MYYHKSRVMKHTLLLLACCLLAGGAFASTCETRVDAHQKATTLQRIAYCLTPETVRTQDTTNGLVFSGVTPRSPEGEAAPVTASARDGYYNEEKVAVTRSFVGTSRYPQLASGRAPQGNGLVPQEHQMIDEYAPVNRQAALQEALQLKAQLRTYPTETTSGTKSRLSKPSRRWVTKPKAVVVTKQETVLVDEPTAVEVESMAQTYTYDTPVEHSEDYALAPSTDVQRAQEYVPATN